MNENFFQSLQKLNAQAKQVQESLENITATGNSGGDMVSVVMDGHFMVQSVTIDESLLAEEHKKVLEEMVQAASIDATKKIREQIQQKVGGQWSSLMNFGG